jgi:phage portal protein BeeE
MEPPFWAPQNPLSFTTLSGDKETIANSFSDYAKNAYKASAVVFACMFSRVAVFSQAEFKFQQLSDRTLFGNPALSMLEHPWPNGTTAELLAHMELDNSLAGNFFGTVAGTGSDRRIRRLRPDWVTIVTGSPDDDPFSIEAKPIAYIYQPKSGGRRPDPVILTTDQVVHWSPLPDPEAQWRGMSWLQPVVEEIKGDKAATKHKVKFFEHGATANFVVTYESGVSKESFEQFVALFKQKHGGVDNAYKTIHLGGGADIKTVGADMKQLDFKATQGAGETRIAAASGVHPVVVGLSEGLAGSSLNAGNFAAARRLYAEKTLEFLWTSAATACAKLATPLPAGSRLWFDKSNIPFLREDQKDAADILSADATTVNTLVTAGFDPDAAIAAVTSGDLTKLTGKHSGRFSVQLQPPSSGA